MKSKKDLEHEGLRSKSPTVRARSAASLLQYPQGIDTRGLMQAIQAETVPRVRRMLLDVLEVRQKSSSSQGKGVYGDEIAGPDKALSQSSHLLPDHADIAALIRHELSPPVGWIRLAADEEIASFSNSKTNEAVRRLQRRIDGLVAMIKEAEPLNLHRFSLPHMLVDNWPDVQSVPSITPALGERSIDFDTDEGLFALMLSNVFQNAIDASIEAIGSTDVQIVWGSTDRNYWVRVTNPFKGDKLSMESVVPVGSSSKMAHQGRGLSLITLVATRLGLEIALEGTSGTATFIFSGEHTT